MKKIGLIGGAFNPIHQGHLDICRSLIEDYGADEVWLIPSFKKEKMVIETSLNHRINMIKEALHDFKYESRVKIKRIEAKKKKFVQTYTTLKELKTKYKNYSFIFAFGSDHIATIDQWKNFKKAHELVQLVCYPRVDYWQPGKMDNILKVKAKLHQIEVTKVSSTNIRAGKDLNYFPKLAFQYALEKKLYIKQWLTNMVKSEKIINHSLRVAEAMEKHASFYDLNKTTAYVAGLFHDICKEWDKRELLAFIKKYTLEYKTNCAKVLHQYAGAYYVMFELYIDNEDLYSAISKHATGDMSMNTLDKLLFCLDVFDSNKFKNSLTKIELKTLPIVFKESIDHAFIFIYQKIINYLLNQEDTDQKLLELEKQIFAHHLNELKRNEG